MKIDISKKSNVAWLSGLPMDEKMQDKNEYEENLKPIITVLKIVGLFPVGTSSKGYLRLSWITAYCAVVYIVYVMASTISSIEYVDFHVNRNENVTFYDTVNVVWYIAKTMLILLMPFVMWPETKNFSRYLENWKSFLSQYRRVCSSPLRPSYRVAVAIVVVGCIYECIRKSVLHTVLKWHIGNDFAVVCHYIAHSLPNMLNQSLTFFWCLTCHTVSHVAEKMLNLLQKEIVNFEPSVYTIRHYRDLWLELSNLSQQIGELFACTYCLYLLYDFTLVAAALFFQASDFANNIKWALVSIVHTALNCMFLCSVCSSGQKVQKKVGQEFKKELISAVSKSQNVAVVNELKEFLSTLEYCQPSISLGGFVTVNRKLMVSLGATLVTYFVILLQLNTDNHSTTSSSSNYTFSKNK